MHDVLSCASIIPVQSFHFAVNISMERVMLQVKHARTAKDSAHVHI